MKKIIFSLVVLFFVGCSPKPQKEFDFLCSVYRDGLKKLDDSSVNLTELSTKMSEEIDKNIKTPEIKKSLEVVATATPGEKYSLAQQAAKEFKADFECPEFNEFISKAMSTNSNQKNSPQDPEGDPNETL